MRSPVVEVHWEKGEVPIDLRFAIEEVSVRLEDLKSTIEAVSTDQKDLKSAIEEVSTNQKDLKSAIEGIFTHLKESNPPLKMSTPTEEVSREKGEVSTDLTSAIEEVSTDLKSAIEKVSMEKGQVSSDLKSTVEEVSSEKGEVSTDLKSTDEEVSSEKGEVSTDITSNPSLKMSTPTEEVSREKEEVSTDLKSAIEEVSREKGQVSSDLKSTVEEVSSEKGEVSTDLTSSIEEVATHLKDSNPPLKMSTPTEKVSREKGEVSTDLKSSPIEEVCREIGQVSTDLKSTIEEVSAQLKESNYEDWILRFTNLTQLVYNFADQHFPSSKQQKIADIEHQIHLCVKALDSVPPENRESNRERTLFEYLKGRFYNAVPGVYKKEAESHLQKSIDLNPHLRNAWNSIASCFIKKRDFNRAEKCYQIALKMGKEHIIILRDLAALELKISLCEDSENPAQHVEESIKYTKRALLQNANDGNCLYTLGCAHFSYFVLSGGRDHNNLQLALKAFEEAKEDVAVKSNPHLEYDCSLVNRYLENYKESLNGFSDAASMNPASDALHQKELTLQLLNKFKGLLWVKRNDKNKGKSKGKSQRKSKGKSTKTSLADLIQSLPNIEVNPPYNRATMDLLTEGPNKLMAVVAAVRCLVKYEYKAPVYYMLCDSDEKSFVLAVFGIQKEAIKQGDQITILDPVCKFVDFVREGKHYQFKSVRVNLLEQVLLNGNPLPPSSAISKPL
ncbi:tetratricopeptide repeat protein 5-like [Solanum pennellii]|uniref:Tetratricopeptide repeat protein 5-like n=1 Tax=Solanum pennellii TaxID=28526 RepID=A0ABM1V3I6_SOLPN|nr:tetratricopeptide repeat protein 5-like [Solanum pennellii]